jgi:hypothetical protein
LIRRIERCEVRWLMLLNLRLLLRLLHPRISGTGRQGSTRRARKRLSNVRSRSAHSLRCKVRSLHRISMYAMHKRPVRQLYHRLLLLLLLLLHLWLKTASSNELRRKCLPLLPNLLLKLLLLLQRRLLPGGLLLLLLRWQLLRWLLHGGRNEGGATVGKPVCTPADSAICARFGLSRRLSCTRIHLHTRLLRCVGRFR